MSKQSYSNYYREYFKGKGKDKRLAAQKRYRDKLKAQFPEATSAAQAAEMKRKQKLLQKAGA